MPAFVAKMNALAVSLGATHTHYVDASGYDPQSVSTASDVLRMAAAGMAIPTFAEVVDMPTVTLPLVGYGPQHRDRDRVQRGGRHQVRATPPRPERAWCWPATGSSADGRSWCWPRPSVSTYPAPAKAKPGHRGLDHR